MIITVLNIPNFYCNYYLLGLNDAYSLKYKADTRFEKFNNKPLLILEVNSKVVVIDNNDPIGVVPELYEACHLYFATNKLKDNPSYSQQKVRPLFPHYPVAIIPLYCGLFRFNLVRHLKWKDLLQQLYIQWRRPQYESTPFKNRTSNFVFFSANIWKKEAGANAIRAAFIRFCKNDARIQFEGGFVGRSDNNNLGFDDLVNDLKYSPKKFSKLSSQSLVVLNNPAVCDAVSWRLAEYLNQGLFVMSFPFKIELPVEFVNEENIHFIDAVQEYKDVFDRILSDVHYHDKIAVNGKKYFEDYCTPGAQAKYIVSQVLHKD